MTLAADPARQALLRRGFALEYATLAWNLIGIVVLAIAAVSARSVALAGFGLDSLIEIGASTVVIWELSGTGGQRQRRSLRLIGYAFAALAAYLLVQSSVVLATGYHPRHSVPGIIWTAMTAAVMFALAAGKARTGAALGNPVLQTEGRVTLIDGILATAVLLGLVLNAALGWWWADPAAGYVLVFYAAREVRDIFITNIDGGYRRPGQRNSRREVSETRDGKDASAWPQAHSCGVPSAAPVRWSMPIRARSRWAAATCSGLSPSRVSGIPHGISQPR